MYRAGWFHVFLISFTIHCAVSVVESVYTTAPSRDIIYRPGKQGAAGPRGPPGPAGAPGNCSCDNQKWKALEEQYKELNDHVERIRGSDPVKFCLLGMKQGLIPDSAITASSNPNIRARARLYSTPDGWYPSSNHVSRAGREWIMVDLRQPRTVSGVVTQGRHNANHWTTTFKVEYSLDGKHFIDVLKKDRSERVFDGNTDRSTVKINRFPNPVETRFIRFYPMSWTGHAFLRFDLIDC